MKNPIIAKHYGINTTPSNSKMQKCTRYGILPWVCDYGIYDFLNNEFIGKPIGSYQQCKSIYNIMFKGIVYSKLEYMSINSNGVFDVPYSYSI